MELIKYVEQQTAQDISKFDFFKAGDNVAVTYQIIEGEKTREQTFRGNIIQIKGTGSTKTFTIRKVSNGIGVERIFPFNCPTIVSITNLKRGKIRRARLYYLRNVVGKTRIKEKKFLSEDKKKELTPPSEKKTYLPLKGKKRKMSWNWEDKTYK